MSGGAHPNRAGDAYFGLYCLAMGTGRARSAAEISGHLQAAGFGDIATPKTGRPFITSVVQARKA
jgi:demethylspheroidene O-methyltransferase